MTEEFIQKEKDLMAKFDDLLDQADECLLELKAMNYTNTNSKIQALLRFKEAVMWMNRAVENPEKPGRS